MTEAPAEMGNITLIHNNNNNNNTEASSSRMMHTMSQMQI